MKYEKKKYYRLQFTTVDGSRIGKIYPNKSWRKFKKDCSWIYSSGAIKDKEMMLLIEFTFKAGWDSALIDIPEEKIKTLTH